MILSRLQFRRFFALFDQLTLYANARLDVVDDDELRTSSGLEEQAQAEVSRELWQNLNVIDEFVRDNPGGLSAGELACVASWRDGLTGTFIVDIFPDGKLRFINGGWAFEVSGLSKEIEGMLAELPAAVYTTLLPFDGRIVYAEYLAIHSVAFGDGMLDIFDDEIERLFDEGRLVSTADDLLETARSIREAELARDTADMLADLESGRFGGSEGAAHHHGHADGTGHDHGHRHDHAHDDWDDEDFDEDFDPALYEQHRGVLAGLAFDEREQTIRDYMKANDDFISNHLIDLLDEDCEELPVVTGLADLLMREHQQDVRRFATYLGLSVARGMSDEEVRQAALEQVKQPGSVQRIVDELTEFQIASMRMLAQKGGSMTVHEDDVVSLRDLPVHELGLSYVFHDGENFRFVMPDEVLAIAHDIDWDGAIGKAQRYRALIDLCDDVAELRGLAPLADVVTEYQRCYPDGYQAMADIVAKIVQAAKEGSANYELLETPEHVLYLLHYELFWAYQEVMGLEDEPYESDPITHGELGELLEGLLAQQEGKEPRPLEPDMLACTNLLEWKLRQPATQAFTRFLDEHVPAARDDYFFADKVVEELLEDAMWGLQHRGAQQLFDILDANDFMPTTDQMQELLNLWSNLGNSLPIWPNNGWSPIELAQAESGGRLFFNPDGSPMKVGRNDPCPCGSGLKYKKCHGR